MQTKQPWWSVPLASGISCSVTVRFSRHEMHGYKTRTIGHRLKGLLGIQPAQLKQNCIVISPCKSIHTYGMKYPIDIAFCDARGRCVLSERKVTPRNLRSHPHAAYVLERFASAGPWPERGEKVTVLGGERER